MSAISKKKEKENPPTFRSTGFFLTPVFPVTRDPLSGRIRPTVYPLSRYPRAGCRSRIRVVRNSRNCDLHALARDHLRTVDVHGMALVDDARGDDRRGYDRSSDDSCAAVSIRVGGYDTAYGHGWNDRRPRQPVVTVMVTVVIAVCNLHAVVVRTTMHVISATVVRTSICRDCSDCDGCNDDDFLVHDLFLSFRGLSVHNIRVMYTQRKMNYPEPLRARGSLTIMLVSCEGRTQSADRRHCR